MSVLCKHIMLSAGEKMMYQAVKPRQGNRVPGKKSENL